MAAATPAYPKRSSFSTQSSYRSQAQSLRRHSAGFRRDRPYDNSPLPASVRVPRTSCPEDTNAFSYDPKHLKAWHMSPDLWAQLPDSLRTSLMALQHAGAAVLTGFERLEKLRASLPDVDEREEEFYIASTDRGLCRSMSESYCRHYSFASSVPGSALPSLTNSALNSPVTISSPGLESPVSELCPPVNTPYSEKDIAAVTLSDRSVLRPSPRNLPTPPPEHVYSPSGQISPPVGNLLLKPFRTIDTIPTDPATAYYHAELSHLRSDAIVHLRHCTMRVDADCAEAKRDELISADVEEAFDEWWSGIKGKVWGLDVRGKAMAERVR